MPRPFAVGEEVVVLDGDGGLECAHVVGNAIVMQVESRLDYDLLECEHCGSWTIYTTDLDPRVYCCGCILRKKQDGSGLTSVGESWESLDKSEKICSLNPEK